MGSLVEAWAWGTIILLGTGMTTTVGATCLLSSMSIETTTGGLAISGCYRETVYGGLYETTVWTLEGSDIADSGTAAIVADLVSPPPCCVHVMPWCLRQASRVCFPVNTRKLWHDTSV